MRKQDDLLHLRGTEGKEMAMLSFYKGRKVFLTGHTGFKGSWMCTVLKAAGAEVVGYSLKPPEGLSLYNASGAGEGISSYTGDIRDMERLWQAFEGAQPEVVIHMAAQPLVRESYRNPSYTYEVNVMGTVNILECVRKCPSVKSFVNVTTDKVYLNREWEWGYRENEVLNGYDPYSNSKSCSELVTSSYLNSFFRDRGVAISTVRAGNVIGGGDFSADRILPDCIRAALEGKDILVRNPYSVRPYQHVLEPVVAYLMIAAGQFSDKGYMGNYNIGPSEEDCRSTGDLATLFCDQWNALGENTVQWVGQNDGGPHEADFLKLDCSRMKKVFGWSPKWGIETAVEKVIEWVRVYQAHGDIRGCMERQIREYLLSEKGKNS